MLKKNSLILALVCLASSLYAQDEYDALLLGQTYHYGTARSLSLSGAMGSVGADYGAIGINPAGLALFRSSELSFTPTVLATTAESQYTNSTTTRSDARFNFNQAGIVFANAKKGNSYNRSKWKTSNIAVGFNRLANLHTDFAYRGRDNQSSFVEVFEEEINAAGGYNNEVLQVVSEAAYGAYETYLIDADPLDASRAKSFVPYAAGLERSKTVRRTGGVNELAFSYAANYDEKVMIGATLGIPIIDFDQTTILTEDDISGNTNNDFEYVDLVQNLSIEGSGINLKLGSIFRPNKYTRFGLALHTPTWYTLTDVSSIAIESNTENLLNTGSVSTYIQENANLFEYRYLSPMRAIASGTILFDNKGFISIDAEWINYAGMRYRYNRGFEGAESIVNNAIQQAYQNAANIRLGGELRIDQLALRGGFAYLGNPSTAAQSKASQSISLGVGYRGKHFYLDVAGRLLLTNNLDQTHTLARTNNIPIADISARSTNIAMTAGFRF